MTDGVTTLNVDRTSISDEVLVNRGGSTSVQAIADLATQLAGTGPLADAIDGAAAGLVRAATLTALNVIPGTRIGQPGEVTADGANNGSYSWSGTAWVRVGDISAGAALVALDLHVADHSNPHGVTKAQVGLGNVDNTADLNKPVSNATRALVSNLNEQTGSRPGDAPDHFVKSLDGGDPALLPAIDSSNIRHDDAGFVVRQQGDGILASRALYPLEPGRKYLVEYAVQRRVNSPDPDNDAIKCAIAWYDQTRTILGQATVQNLLGVTIGSGRLTVQAVISRDVGDDVSIVSPANARYVRPYIQTYGTLVQSDVEIIRWADITNATTVSPDVSALESRISAQESLDAGARLTTIEAAVTAPNTLRLPLLSDLIDNAVAATVDVVELQGRAVVGDQGAGCRLTRETVADPGSIGTFSGIYQSVDGAYWKVRNISPAIEMLIPPDIDVDGDYDISDALQGAIDFIPAIGGQILMHADQYTVSTAPSYGDKSIQFDIRQGTTIVSSVWPRFATNPACTVNGPYIRSGNPNLQISGDATFSFAIESYPTQDINRGYGALYIGARLNTPLQQQNTGINISAVAAAGTKANLWGIEVDMVNHESTGAGNQFGVSVISAGEYPITFAYQCGSTGSGNRFTYGLQVNNALIGVGVLYSDAMQATGNALALNVGGAAPARRMGSTIHAVQFSNNTGSVLALQRWTDNSPGGNFISAVGRSDGVTYFLVNTVGHVLAMDASVNYLTLRGAVVASASGTINLGGQATVASALPSAPSGKWAISVSGVTKYVYYYDN